MATKATTRKQRNRTFRAMLAYAGMKEGEFATKINVHANHLSLVLNGDRESARVDREIAAFIVEFSQKFCNDPLVSDAA